MSAIREILVVPHTHHDLGYTDTPLFTAELHEEAIRRALALLDEPVEDERARFAWTCEVARPLDRLLQSSPELRGRLLAAADAGSFAVCGGFLNLTQLVEDGGYDHSFAAARRLREAGFAIRTVQHGDVNGIGWGVVPAMRRNGLDTLVMALNPDHGRAPLEQPSVFWWRGPDGSRVLAALHDHYALGESWGIMAGRAPDPDVVGRYVARLEAREDYPFDIAVVHAAFDNRAPVPHVSRAVSAWNQRHPELPMRITTMAHVVEQWWAGPLDQLAEYRGEWADWWAHGHGSSAREVAAARRAGRLRRTASRVLAANRLSGDVVAAGEAQAEWYGPPALDQDHAAVDRMLAGLDDNLALFQEHTWGSRESIRAPHSAFTRTHFSQKAAFAWNALDLAAHLGAQAVASVARPGPNYRPETDPYAIPTEAVVVNTGDTPRREMVQVEVENARRWLWVDAEAASVQTVPLFEPEWHAQPSGRLVVQGYEIEVRPESGGVTSLRRRSDGRELVDDAAPFALAAIVYESVPANSDHPVVTRRRQDFHPDFPGPDFDRIAASGPARIEVAESADGAWSALRWEAALSGRLSADVTMVVSGLDVKVFVRLDKRSTLEVEGVYVTFPFAIDDPRFLLHTTDAVFEAEREQLPNTCRDWYSVQQAVGVAGDQGGGVLWGTLDAPLVQVGGFHAGRWAERLEPEGGHVNAWLMNNLYFTNFKASQGGQDHFEFAFRPADAVTKNDVARFGAAIGLEPLVAPWSGWRPTGSVAHVILGHRDWLLADVALRADGVHATIRSLSSEPTLGTLGWSGTPIHADTPEVSAVIGGQNHLELSLAAYGEVPVILTSEKGKVR